MGSGSTRELAQSNAARITRLERAALFAGGYLLAEGNDLIATFMGLI